MFHIFVCRCESCVQITFNRRWRWWLRWWQFEIICLLPTSTWFDFYSVCIRACPCFHRMSQKAMQLGSPNLPQKCFTMIP